MEMKKKVQHPGSQMKKAFKGLDVFSCAKCCCWTEQEDGENETLDLVT